MAQSVQEYTGHGVKPTGLAKHPARLGGTFSLQETHYYTTYQSSPSYLPGTPPPNYTLRPPQPPPPPGGSPRQCPSPGSAGGRMDIMIGVRQSGQVSGQTPALPSLLPPHISPDLVPTARDHHQQQSHPPHLSRDQGRVSLRTSCLQPITEIKR